jgi:hypothetical protein
MATRILACCLLAAALGLAGCAPVAYQVQVNGYTDPTTPGVIAPGGAFFVMENKEAKNPLLEKEVKGKIVKLLESQGYSQATLNKAQYLLFFGYDIGPGRSVTVVFPDFYPYGWGFYPGYPRSYFFASPFAGYWPYTETIYDRWLLIKVVDAKTYRDIGEFKSVWVGEARSTGASQDLRVLINYLLKAVFEQFGKNTGKAVVVEVREQDAVIRDRAK